MGGTESELWVDFQTLLLKGLMAARKHMDRIVNIVDIMRSSKFYCIVLEYWNIKGFLWLFRLPIAMFQKWLFKYGTKPSQALPYEFDRGGTSG